jgi:hypothetical protein
MARHNDQTIGNGTDLIGWKNTLPDFRRATMQFEAGLKRTLPSQDRLHPSTLPRRRRCVISTWLAITILIFPLLSARGDFHVCQLALEFLANPAEPLPRVRDVAHPPQGSDGVSCSACVWSSFENASPSNPISLDPASNFLMTGFLSLPCSPAFQLFASTAGRSPPVA